MAEDKETLVVGDLHGQIEAAHFAVKYADERGMDMIFLGDLSDSFSKTKKDQLACMQLVLRRLDKGDKCLWGNHDLSYIDPQNHRCAGYTKTKENYFIKAYGKLWQHENFVPYIYLEDYKILLTHAGLSASLVPDEYKTEPVEFLKKETEKDDFLKTSPLVQAGRAHGGFGLCGGIFWLRPRNYKPLLRAHIRQVVGHTPQRAGIARPDQSLWVIDTIEYGSKDLVKITTDGQIKTVTKDQYWK